jgi:ribokinase
VRDHDRTVTHPTLPPTDRPLDLLVVGDANPDLVLRGDVAPRWGQAEQLLDAADLTLGGSAAIVAAGAARLGLRTALVARVGADVFGDLVLSWLRARTVDVTRVIVDLEASTGLSVVLSGAEDRSILTLPGAIPHLDPTDVDDATLGTVRHLHVGSFFLQPALAAGLPALLARAHDAGCTVSLDTNWDPAERWEGLTDVLPLVDVFLPNAAELLAIAGVSPDSEDALVRAANVVADQGPLIALKNGSAGALGWGPEGAASAPGEAVDVVDTTGAGDSFDAGFLWAWLAGRPFDTCLRAAAVAGSLSTRAGGGTAAQATSEELLVH